MQSETKISIAVASWLAVCVIGLIVPVILGILIGITPDHLIHRASAGQFVSANASAGGFATPGITTIQTTQGSFVVTGELSVNRGQALDVLQTLKHGPQLCVYGPTQTCADLSGKWAGPMQDVAYPHHWTNPLVTHLGAEGVSLWFVIGLFATFVWGIAMAIVTGPDKPD